MLTQAPDLMHFPACPGFTTSARIKIAQLWRMDIITDSETTYIMFSQPDYQQHLARPYRKALLNALLIITFFSGLLFAWINFGRNNPVVAIAELVMATYSMILLFIIRDTQRLEFWAMAYLFPFFTIMMVAMASPRSTLNIFIWIFLIPIVAHLLVGRVKGLGMTLFYIGIAAGIFFWRFGEDPEVMQPVILSNIGVLTLCLIAFSHVYEITRERTEQRLSQQANTDPLTQLPNRAHLQSRFDLERLRHQRQGSPLTLVLLDLDFFKRINDTHGHAAGDKVLQYFANLMRTAVRQTDLIARLGGEEFCLLLPDTNADQAFLVAEKIRHRLARAAVDIEGSPVSLTVSGGIAQLGADGDSLDVLTRNADEKLYEAKATGRNRVAR